MYVKRTITPVFSTALKQFPAVLLTGPRQSGKTTFLLQEISKKGIYITFDDPLQREIALNDPKGFLDNLKQYPIILDEIQYVPELFPYIKMIIDADRTSTARWILTGSQQFHLMKNISESLAGRIAILDLLPFDFGEISSFSTKDLEDILWDSSYPEPAIHRGKRDLWLRSYVQTYIERDVRQLLNVQDINVFTHFISVAASRHGQEFKKSIFSREVGVSQPTIKKWISILEASYLIYLIPPYFKNLGKRLIKTPKLYFLDPAMVAYLTRQPDKSSLVAGPMGGPIFEGWVISESIKTFLHLGRRPNLYFWRSRDGLEVDLIVAIGSKFFPIEIKLTATPRLQHVAALTKLKKMLGKDAGQGLLVCRTDQKISMPDDNLAIPWHEYPSWLKKQLTVMSDE